MIPRAIPCEPRTNSTVHSDRTNPGWVVRLRFAAPALAGLLILATLPFGGATDGTSRTASTYVGGSAYDALDAIDLGPDGSVYVGGRTTSSDVPGGASPSGLMIARLSNDLSQVRWSRTFADAFEGLEAIAVAPDGSLYAAGTSRSGTIPTTSGAYDRQPNGYDAFVVKYSAAGVFLWGTYLGGSDYDSAEAIDIDPSGRVTIAGRTFSCDFPTTSGAYDRSTVCANGQGERDTYVAKLSSDGTRLEASTLYGGPGWEIATSLAVSPDSGSVLIAGVTTQGVPTTSGAYDRTFNGGEFDAFVAKFDNALSRLQYATLYGGSGSEDWPVRIARDADSNVYLVGTTGSQDLPTTPGAYLRTFQSPTGCQDGPDTYNAPCEDMYAVKFTKDLASTTFATYFGGQGTDLARGLALDAQRRLHVVGETDFDGFYAILSPDGRGVEHKEPVAGPGSNDIQAVALANGVAFTAGYSGEGAPISTAAADQTAGGIDGYVARFAKTTPVPTSGVSFTHGGGNEWWVELRVEPKPASVQAMDTNGPWTMLSFKDWGEWAGSFRIEPGNQVRFRASYPNGTTVESCWFTHPAGASQCGATPPPPPASNSSFGATFKNVRGNEWWIETDVTVAGGTLAGVDARVTGGSWIALAKQSYGSWAKSIYAPSGANVEFRARATDGATDTSAGYRWPPA